MIVQWRATGDYDEVGGRDALRHAILEARRHVPPDHLRGLDAIIALDHDPRGSSLGLWHATRSGVVIELYLSPHVETTRRAPPGARDFALRLYLAHTLYHEVGHHLTLVVNRRTKPSRRSSRVDQTIERWAEDYVPRRLQRLCSSWLSPPGPASSPSSLAHLDAALRFLRLREHIELGDPPP